MFSNPVIPLQILAQFLIPMVFMGIPPRHTSILESCPLQYDFKSKNIPGLQIKQIQVPITLLETTTKQKPIKILFIYSGDIYKNFMPYSPDFHGQN